MELYCFSATGNSLRAAETARRICGDAPLFLAVFPVHAQTLPSLVRIQLNALPQRVGPACILCTYGGVSPGSAVADAAKILTVKGLTVLAAAELPDRHSYDRAGENLTVPRRWTEPELEHFLAQALKKAAEGGGPAALPQRRSLGRYLPQRPLAILGTRYPAADTDRCTQCRACERCCPTGAAQGDKKSCIRCAACVDACPAGARTLHFRTPVTQWYLERGISRPKEPAFYL